MMKAITGWKLVTAITVEGACLLVSLLCRLAGLWITYLWLAGALPGKNGLWILLLAVGHGLVLAPMRLWRIAFYKGSPITLWHCLVQGISWRWQLWWRRTGLLALLWIPTALLWGRGDYLHRTHEGLPILCLLLGILTGLLALISTWLWQCRYAAAPLLILQGHSAGAAMQLSLRVMRRRLTAYINFLGEWFLPLAACLLLLPAIWILPQFRAAHWSLLQSWTETAG